MEVLELVARTENCSWIDASLELPPNQQDPNTSAFILLGKIITYKNLGTASIIDVVNRAWRPTFQIWVSHLDKNTFMFHFIWWWIPFLCCYLMTDSWQVATRFLSASPPLYWFASHLMVHPGSNRWAYLIWAYSAAYILLGSLLFSNFYPFTW